MEAARVFTLGHRYGINGLITLMADRPNVCIFGFHVNKMCGDYRNFYVTGEIKKLYVSIMAISPVRRMPESSARSIIIFRGSRQKIAIFNINKLKVNKGLVYPQLFLQTLQVQ